MNLAEFIFELDEGTRCWKGYERKGFKTMFGKRVPNCVKREDRYLVVDKFNQPVKLFDNEQEAVTYFKENYHLLDSCELHDLEESHHAGLRAWFGKGKKGGAGGGGWDRYNTKGERIGKCGDRKASEGKRRKDKNPERRGKAINVSNKPRKKKK
jgi:hypothetical protein